MADWSPEPSAQTVEEWRRLSDDELKAAALTLKGGAFKPCYGGLGLAVEHRLKALYLHHRRPNAFPGPRQARALYSHRLDKIFVETGCYEAFREAAEADPNLMAAWQVVKDWRINGRYARMEMPRTVARDMMTSVTRVVRWIDQNLPTR